MFVFNVFGMEQEEVMSWVMERRLLQRLLSPSA